MGYSVYLFRKEMKEKYPSEFEFLEDEDQIVSFTKEQFEGLKKRLISYGYQVEQENDQSVLFNFKGGKFDIEAALNIKCLSFSSTYSEDGIAEILLTSSEFTDSGEFAKLDLQVDGWEQSW